MDFFLWHAVILSAALAAVHHVSFGKGCVSFLLGWGASMLGSFFLAIVLRLFVFEPIEVTGPSMAPTVKDGDILFVSKVSDVDRGDLVLFRSPDGNHLFIKRVVGLPGDVVEGRDSRLVVNGKAYGNYTGLEPFAPIKVPDAHYFVLGDLPNNSLDSREFGPVPAEAVGGEAVLIWSDGQFSRPDRGR